MIFYFLVPKKARNFVLFVFSLVFYAWGEPMYIVLMLFSTVVDYTHGMLIDKFKRQGKMGAAKAALISSVIVNLSLLGFFKYADFLIGSFNGLFGTDIPIIGVPLPIGISFYTFQTMSYSIDVYRGDAKVQRNIITFGSFVTLFPQLIAGPIIQYNQVDDQLRQRQESFDLFGRGVQRFVIGMGKKVLLANNIGMLWDEISAGDLSTLPVLTAWLGIIAFSFQIYFDFSGYSDMAIGLGRMFGFEFIENFNYPYISKSITEFWRRWHMSLGSWFRDYVYIPLGGNRQGMAKQIRNICVVWALTGIWHGASWNFLLWGVYFGAILIMEKLFLLKLLKKAPAVISHIYSVFLIIIGWVIFAFDDMGRGLKYLGAMFGAGGSLYNGESIYILASYALIFVILIIAATPLGKILWEKLKEPRIKTVAMADFVTAVMIFSTSYIVDSTYNPFLYFRF